MRYFLLFVPILLFESCKQPVPVDTVKAFVDSLNTAKKRDSIEMQDRQQTIHFMFQMQGLLEKQGYSRQKASAYIDSVELEFRKGKLPDWYYRVEKERDSMFNSDKPIRKTK